KRLMFDFMVPEPAAFFLPARQQNQKRDLPPEPPALTETVEDINELNYASIAARYGATKEKTPPAPFLSVSKIFTNQRAEDSGEILMQTAEINVPVGYEAWKVYLARWGTFRFPENEFRAFVDGARYYDTG